jgi:hypothetical protein
MARRSAVANMRAWLREEESKSADQLVAEARAYAAEQQRKRDERARAEAAADDFDGIPLSAAERKGMGL